MIRVLAWLDGQQIYNHVLDEQQAIEMANELEKDGCVVRLVEGPKTKRGNNRSVEYPRALVL